MLKWRIKGFPCEPANIKPKAEVEGEIISKIDFLYLNKLLVTKQNIMSVIAGGTNNLYPYTSNSPFGLLAYIRSGGSNLKHVQEIVESEPHMSMQDLYECFISAVHAGDLNLVKYMSRLPGTNAAYQHNQAIVSASWLGHLDVIKYLITLPGVDITDRNNQAIIEACRTSSLDVIKFIITLPNVDVTAQNNRAIINAFSENSLDVIDFLLTLPGVDVTVSLNAIIHGIGDRYDEDYLIKSAILLYWVPSIKQTVYVDNYKRYHIRQCRSIVPYVHKIATVFTELPTPLIIEIIEQVLDRCIYIPYHIKWNMVVKIKHWKP